jgi:hypothetical protein
MPFKRNIYRRTYVMFQEEDKGCAFDENKELSGYLKIETRGNKGRITASFQNLNPEFTYNIKAFKDYDMPAVVDFGAIRIDSKGRGGAEWTFDADNIQNTGTKLEELSVMFVEADIGKEKLIPLSSILDKRRFNWKTLYKKLQIKNDNNINEQKELSFEEVEEVKDLKDEVEENNFNEETETQFIVTDKIQYGSTEVENNVNESKGFEIGDEGGNNGYIKYLREYVNNIINYLDEVHPFEKDFKGYRWWRVNTSYRDGNYDHYLVGFANDDRGKLKYIIYGMPGFFTLSDQPFNGMTGFVYWKPIKENMRGSHDEGYWLLYIDAKTGQIVVPNGPTPPPMI